MTLPSSGQVKYRFSGDGFMAADVLKNSVNEKELVYQREYDGASTQVSELWQYSITENFCQITAPDQGITKEYFRQTNVAYWDSGLVYKTENPDGSVVERFWKQNIPTGYGDHTPVIANQYLKTEYTSIKNAAGALVKTAIKDFTYDKNGNLTQEADYDWVDYGAVPRDGAGKPSGVLPFSPKRVTVNSYYNSTPNADSPFADPDIYTQYTAPAIRNATESGEVRSGTSTSTALSRTELFYDNPSTTGNLIQQTSWDSTKGGYSNPLCSNPALCTINSISVSHQYDAYGNRTLTTDADLHKTRFLYGAVNGVPDLYPTEIKSAFDTSIVRTETREYDFRSGAVTRVTDVDNNVSSSTTYDVFGRPILVRSAEGLAEETTTVTEYSDVNRRVIVRSDLNSVGDGKLVTIQHHDQLGRIRLSRQLEDAATQSATDETTGTKVQTRYMYSGSYSYQLTSNPYRAALSSSAGPETTMGWTRSKSDNGGRLLEVQTFGGPVLPAPWGANSTSTGTVTSSYNAEFTTVTDQDARLRRSRVDGLGGLVRVDEPDRDTGLLDDQYGNPVQTTDYFYDASGSLRHVTQGQQHRFFMYDSLSRLLRSSNPEQQDRPSLALPDPVTLHSQWSTKYVYDNSGNLVQKTDARGVESNFEYDALNRNLSVVTTDPNTPAITRTYDTATLGKGRLRSTQTSGTNGSLTTIDTYDALGQAKAATQTMGSQSYVVAYNYDLAGHLKKTTYPSGNTVTNNYDNAGRTSSVAGNLGDLGDAPERNYSTSISYSPNGGLSQEQLGTTTPIYNKLFYNSRGQLAEIREGLTPNNDSWQRGALINFYSTCWGKCYENGASVSMPGNNGNLKAQEYWIPDSAGAPLAIPAQHYEYDQLNRLKRVYEGSSTQPAWQQQFVYDRYGNRALNSTSLLFTGFEVETATNRLLAPGDSALSEDNRQMRYDKAGNLSKDSYTGQGDRNYDAENRMTRAWANNQWQEYTYNGDGQRERRKVNGVETWQVYGVGGELLGEYAANADHAVPQKEYGYRNGQLLITATAAISWGSPPVLDDNPLNPHYSGETTVQSRHITQFRAAIDALRTHLGMSAFSWQQAAGIGDWIKADPILEMRTALDQALGAPSSGYSAGLAQGQPIKAIHIQELRDRVLNRWSSGGADLRWLVADQLGTPRMIFDQTGSLANVSRHDYLPFGEDLLVNGRGTSLGYNSTDGARQKFTQKERDDETALDYFLVRYYSSKQGRFTSPDEFTGGSDELYAFAETTGANPTFYANLANPQSLNKYHYALDNPLRYVDADGHVPCCVTDEEFKTAMKGASEVGKGVVKEAANIGIGMGNTAAGFMGGDQHALFKESNRTQALAMDITADIALVGSFLSTGKPKIGGVLVAEAEETAIVGSSKGTAAQVPKEGVYEFPDAHAPGKTYVGQSGNMPQRLGTHRGTGRLASGETPSTSAVGGGRLSREMVEQGRINQLGGTRNVPGSRTSNIRNPVSQRRQQRHNRQ